MMLTTGLRTAVLTVQIVSPPELSGAPQPADLKKHFDIFTSCARPGVAPTCKFAAEREAREYR